MVSLAPRGEARRRNLVALCASSSGVIARRGTSQQLSPLCHRQTRPLLPLQGVASLAISPRDRRLPLEEIASEPREEKLVPSHWKEYRSRPAGREIAPDPLESPPPELAADRRPPCPEALLLRYGNRNVEDPSISIDEVAVLVSDASAVLAAAAGALGDRNFVSDQRAWRVGDRSSVFEMSGDVLSYRAAAAQRAAYWAPSVAALERDGSQIDALEAQQRASYGPSTSSRGRWTPAAPPNGGGGGGGARDRASSAPPKPLTRSASVDGGGRRASTGTPTKLRRFSTLVRSVDGGGKSGNGGAAKLDLDLEPKSGNGGGKSGNGSAAKLDLDLKVQVARARAHLYVHVFYTCSLRVCLRLMWEPLDAKDATRLLARVPQRRRSHAVTRASLERAAAPVPSA